jgi:hypothetical protein
VESTAESDWEMGRLQSSDTVSEPASDTAWVMVLATGWAVVSATEASEWAAEAQV